MNEFVTTSLPQLSNGRGLTWRALWEVSRTRTVRQRQSARERQGHSFHVCSFIFFFFLFFFTSFKNWIIVDFSGIQQRDSVTHIYHIYFFQIFSHTLIGYSASQVTIMIQNPPANAGDVRQAVSIPGLGRSPGGESMTTHSSILAWTIPGTESPDWL